MPANVAIVVRAEGVVRLDQARMAVLKVADYALDEFADTIAEKAQQNIDTWGIADTGALEHSINVESHFLDKSVVVGAPHGAWVEYGTGPAAGRKHYLPPLAPILAWVKRNLRVVPIGDRPTFKPSSKKGTRAPRKAEVEKVANAIRWHIYHYGTAPRPFFRTAIEFAIAEFPAIVQRAASRINAEGRKKQPKKEAPT